MVLDLHFVILILESLHFVILILGIWICIFAIYGLCPASNL